MPHHHTHFNSIKVRLEPSSSSPSPLPGCEFQFHKGAIRTCIFRITEYRKYQFQFHKGAIRTVRDMVKRYNSAHFNSIKVRLEQDAGKLGSLAGLFQFHKGAIRTNKLIPLTTKRTHISIP